MLKNIAANVKGFIKDESGVSGIVVAIALIVIGVLGGYYVYTQNLQPTLNGANSSGTAIQSSGSAASTDWGSEVTMSKGADQRVGALTTREGGTKCLPKSKPSPGTNPGLAASWWPSL